MKEDWLTQGINLAIQKNKKMGWSSKGVSDGYHTFDDLYYHRMILFLTIQKAFIHKSWKSKHHHDGTMFEDSFIVGIETPKGQYSYHYHLKYWDMFRVKELEYAPKWDGHTAEDIVRLFSLLDGDNK